MFGDLDEVASEELASLGVDMYQAVLQPAGEAGAIRWPPRAVEAELRRRPLLSSLRDGVPVSACVALAGCVTLAAALWAGARKLAATPSEAVLAARAEDPKLLAARQAVLAAKTSLQNAIDSRDTFRFAYSFNSAVESARNRLELKMHDLKQLEKQEEATLGDTKKQTASSASVAVDGIVGSVQRLLGCFAQAADFDGSKPSSTLREDLKLWLSKQYALIRVGLAKLLPLAEESGFVGPISYLCTNISALCEGFLRHMAALDPSDCHRKALDWAALRLCWLVRTVSFNVELWRGAGVAGRTVPMVLDWACDVSAELDAAWRATRAALKDCRPTNAEVSGPTVAALTRLLRVREHALGSDAVQWQQWSWLHDQLQGARDFVGELLVAAVAYAEANLPRCESLLELKVRLLATEMSSGAVGDEASVRVTLSRLGALVPLYCEALRRPTLPALRGYSLNPASILQGAAVRIARSSPSLAAASLLLKHTWDTSLRPLAVHVLDAGLAAPAPYVADVVAAFSSLVKAPIDGLANDFARLLSSPVMAELPRVWAKLQDLVGVDSAIASARLNAALSEVLSLTLRMMLAAHEASVDAAPLAGKVAHGPSQSLVTVAPDGSAALAWSVLRVADFRSSGQALKTLCDCLEGAAGRVSKENLVPLIQGPAFVCSVLQHGLRACVDPLIEVHRRFPEALSLRSAVEAWSSMLANALHAMQGPFGEPSLSVCQQLSEFEQCVSRGPLVDGLERALDDWLVRLDAMVQDCVGELHEMATHARGWLQAMERLMERRADIHAPEQQVFAPSPAAHGALDIPLMVERLLRTCFAALFQLGGDSEDTTRVNGILVELRQALPDSLMPRLDSHFSFTERFVLKASFEMSHKGKGFTSNCYVEAVYSRGSSQLFKQVPLMHGQTQIVLQLTGSALAGVDEVGVRYWRDGVWTAAGRVSLRDCRVDGSYRFDHQKVVVGSRYQRHTQFVLRFEAWIDPKYQCKEGFYFAESMVDREGFDVPAIVERAERTWQSLRPLLPRRTQAPLLVSAQPSVVDTDRRFFAAWPLRAAVEGLLTEVDRCLSAVAGSQRLPGPGQSLGARFTGLCLAAVPALKALSRALASDGISAAVQAPLLASQASDSNFHLDKVISTVTTEEAQHLMTVLQSSIQAARTVLLPCLDIPLALCSSFTTALSVARAGDGGELEPCDTSLQALIRSANTMTAPLAHSPEEHARLRLWICEAHRVLPATQAFLARKADRVKHLEVSTRMLIPRSEGEVQDLLADVGACACGCRGGLYGPAICERTCRVCEAASGTSHQRTRCKATRLQPIPRCLCMCLELGYGLCVCSF
jgi:hypothetical protein